MNRLCLVLLPALLSVTACSSSQSPTPEATSTSASTSTPASPAVEPSAAAPTPAEPVAVIPAPATVPAPKPTGPKPPAIASPAPAPAQPQPPVRPQPRLTHRHTGPDGVITHSSDDNDSFTCEPATRIRLLDLLRQYDPDGYSVFTQEHRVGTKTRQGKFLFDAFLDFGCEDGLDEDAVTVLESSVHETVHDLRAPLGGYLLIGGAVLPDLPMENPDMFPPSQLASQFAANTYTNYLRRGGPSSSSDFTYLLDEMNAYTHDLNTASALDGHSPMGTIYTTDRDGMLSLMDFVAAYAERASAGDARAWTALQREPYRTAVRTLWTQSETVLAENCRHRRQSSEISGEHFRNLRNASRTNGIATLLGRAPAIPQTCL